MSCISFVTYFQVTLVVMAISVAVRVDVYGVFYCLVLGVFLVFPRGLMAPLWLFYLVVHGQLLMLQYSMLLGVPPGACFYPGGQRGLCECTDFRGSFLPQYLTLGAHAQQGLRYWSVCLSHTILVRRQMSDTSSFRPTRTSRDIA